MGISDQIAAFIYELLGDSNGVLELQRQELAKHFNVVPSQINYVLDSRFRPEQGFVIESRRGGGGYIRIYRVESDRAGHVMHIVNAVGDRLDAVTAERYLKNMCGFEVITAEQARLMAAAVSDKGLSRLERERRSEVRADIFKNMLVAIIA